MNTTIKVKLKLWLFLILSTVLVAGSAAPAYGLVAGNGGGGTATSTPYGNTIQGASGNHPYQCAATINPPSSVDGNSNWNFMPTGSTTGIPFVDDTFNAVSGVGLNQPASVISVTFSSPNGAYSKQCASSLGFVQTVDQTKGDDPGNFYGGWYPNDNTNSSNFQLVSAYIDAQAGTIQFTLPNGGGNFDLKLSDPGGVLKNTNYFPGAAGTGGGGSGSTSAGNCFSTALSMQQFSACVKATPAATFNNASSITYGGETFVATTWGGNTMRYMDTSRNTPGGQPELDLNTLGNPPGGLDINLDGNTNINQFQQLAQTLKAASASQKVNLTFINYDSSGNKNSTSDINTYVTASTANIDIFANYYPSNDTVDLVFQNGKSDEQPYVGAYTRTDATHYTYGSGGFSKCSNVKPVISFTQDPHTLSSTYDGIVSASWIMPVNDQFCNSPSIPIRVLVQPANAQAPAAANGTPSTNNPPGIKCSVTVFNPLSWFLCPLAVTLQTLAAALDNEIASMLTINTNNSPTGNNIYRYYDTWKALRDLSLGLIVIAALIAVIAQALGFEVLDAYTLKKALPRVLAVAVGITLSWPLMILFINFTNALGDGVRSIIYTSVKASQGANYSVAFGGGSSFVTGILGGAGLALLGWAGLLSFAATGALAAAIAFLVLVIRQMVVVLLVIFSPIALVAYVLPNTQKAWKFWWDSFSKALLMFPIIMAFLALGHVFAAISSQDAGTVNQILAFVAYFAPYMLLPYTFRLAGGALATIGGAVHGSSKGLFGGLTKYRSNKMAGNFKAMQENRRLNPNAGGIVGRFNRGMNSSLSNITSPGAAAKIYGGKALRGMGVNNSIGMGVMDQITETKWEHSQKLAEKLNGRFNDRALKSLISLQGKDGGYSASNIRDEVTRLRGSSDGNDHLAAEQLEHNAAFISTDLFKDPETGRANVAASAGLALATQGFADTNDIAAVANQLVASGQEGMASTFVGQAQLAGMRAGRMDMKPGYGVVRDGDRYMGIKVRKRTDANGRTVVESSQHEIERATAQQVKRIQSMSLQELQSAKGQSVDDLAEGFQKILSTTNFGPDGTATFFDGTPMKYTINKADVERVAGMMGSAVSTYSSTSPDTSRRIQALAESDVISPEARSAYDLGKRTSIDEASRRSGGGEPEPGGQT